jgi:hypothetical protein
MMRLGGAGSSMIAIIISEVFDLPGAIGFVEISGPLEPDFCAVTALVRRFERDFCRRRRVKPQVRRAGWL